MPSPMLKRPRQDANSSFKPKKRIKKCKRQTEYHSSSSEDEPEPADFTTINLQDSDDDQNEEPAQSVKGILKAPSAQFIEAVDEEENGDSGDTAGGEVEDGGEWESDISSASQDSEGGQFDHEDERQSETSTNAEARKLRKRNDPQAFATSMAKILSSKLSTSKRADPVLSRSKDALTASKELKEARLEARARHKLREDKRLALERGRVRDVLGLESADTSTAEIMEVEKRLKKTAQRGVVRLFNAVRAAQVRAEEAVRQQQKDGVVGLQKREEKVNEMSKQGFLELIAGGGKQKRAGSIESS